MLNLTETLTDIGSVSVFVTACVAVVFGWRQLRLQTEYNRREAQRHQEIRAEEESRHRISAETIWRQYELLCVEHPYFANPSLPEINIDDRTFDDDKHKFISYEYFVSFLIYACEEILGVYGDEEDWYDSVLDELDWHNHYLTSRYFEQFLPTVSAAVQPIIFEMKRYPDKKRH